MPRYYTNRETQEEAGSGFSNLKSILNYLESKHDGELYVEGIPGKIVYNVKTGHAIHQDQVNQVQSIFNFGHHSPVQLLICLLAKLTLIKHLDTLNIPEISTVIKLKSIDLENSLEDINHAVVKALEQTNRLLAEIERVAEEGKEDHHHKIKNVLSRNKDVNSINGAMDVIEMLDNAMNELNNRV